MKCLSCDCILTDFEATRKTLSGHYIDLCNSCYAECFIDRDEVIERDDLNHYETGEEDGTL